jgi:hypothetical protein
VYGGRRATYGPSVASNKVWWAAEPEFYGKIPVRTELTVLPADKVVWCPLCKVDVHEAVLAVHCQRVSDRDHLALEVMET